MSLCERVGCAMLRLRETSDCCEHESQREFESGRDLTRCSSTNSSHCCHSGSRLRVLLLPSTNSPRRARVSSTLSLLQSLRKPTRPWRLARTAENRISSFSRPWKLSTLAISRSRSSSLTVAATPSALPPSLPASFPPLLPPPLPPSPPPPLPRPLPPFFPLPFPPPLLPALRCLHLSFHSCRSKRTCATYGVTTPTCGAALERIAIRLNPPRLSRDWGQDGRG